MTIRRFEEKDARAVLDLIVATRRTTNSVDYSLVYLANDIRHLMPDDIIVDLR